MNIIKIRKENNKYFSDSDVDYPIPVTVDYKNGYIEFKDEGAGGVVSPAKTVLYRKANGSGLIVCATRAFDVAGQEPSIDFYEEKDGKLILNNAKYKKSDLELESIILKEFPYDLDRTIASELITPYFDLPQNGLTIKVDFFLFFPSLTKKRKKTFHSAETL